MKNDFDNDVTFEEPEINFDESMFDEPEINFDTSMFDLNFNKHPNKSDESYERSPKRHELYESKVVSPSELNNRQVKIGSSIELEENNREYTEKVNEIEENFSNPNAEYIVEEDEKQASSSLKKIESTRSSSKQDLVLRHKKEPKPKIGNSFEEEVPEEIEEIEELVIEKPIKKDLVLAKSKFSEEKKESYSWSLEALGMEDDRPEAKKARAQAKKASKKKQKEPGKFPIGTILIVAIALFGLGMFISMQKSGKSFGIMESSDMYPTFEESEFYTAKTITDYNSLNYMDIIIYEVNGEKIPSRIIGFPGDTVMIKNDGVYLNEEKIDPNLIGGEFNFQDIIRLASNEYKFSDGQVDYLFFKLDKKSNQVFLLGDNHANARDSIQYGPIDVTLIKEILPQN